jgi:hypothetical protein
MVRVTEENWEDFRREAAYVLLSQLELDKKYDSATLLLGLSGKYDYSPEQALRVIADHYVPRFKVRGQPDIELQKVVGEPWSFVLSSFTRVLAKRKRTR